MNRVLVLVLIAVFPTIVIADNFDLRRYASPGNGFLTVDQLKVMLLHKTNSFVRILDKNNDGIISDNEIGWFPPSVEKEVKSDVEKSKNHAISLLNDIKYKLGDRVNYSISELETTLALKSKSLDPDEKKYDKKTWDWGLAQARSHLPILGKNMPVNKRKPATLDYTSNGIDDSELLSASGAVYVNSPLADSDTSKHADRFGMSATFKRVEGSDESKNVDNLDLRFSYILKHEIGEGKRLGHELSYVHSTDFDFKTNINGLEYFQMPYFRENCLLGKRCGGDHAYFNFRVSPSFGFIWAKVSEPAPDTKTDSDEEYLRFGAGLDFQLYPRFNRKSFLSVSFDSYSGVVKDKENVEFWDVSFVYPLTSANNVSLVIGYQEGQLLVSEEEVELTKVGLGVRF